MDKAEASYKEFQDLALELAKHYKKINEKNAKELLRFSDFGSESDIEADSLVRKASRLREDEGVKFIGGEP